MQRADAAPAGIAVPMADASPIVAAVPLSSCGLPPSSWSGPLAASVRVVSSLPTDAAARYKFAQYSMPKAPLARGFFVCRIMSGLPVSAVPATVPAAAMPAPVPSVPAPVPATPTPMTVAAPAPMTMPATMPAPAHFFRLQAIDFVARGNGRMGIRMGGKFSASGQRMRSQGCGLRAGRERRRSGREPKGEFQEVPALHAISSSVIPDVRRRVSMRRDEPSLNSAFRFRHAHLAVVPAKAGTHTPCRSK
jgi:hypothetical protein